MLCGDEHHTLSRSAAGPALTHEQYHAAAAETPSSDDRRRQRLGVQPVAITSAYAIHLSRPVGGSSAVRDLIDDTSCETVMR
jgi:hypothetical protein